MIAGHGGNIKGLAQTLNCAVDEIIDMSSNLNPLGPPENIENIICSNIAAIESLPEPDAITMRKGFAKFHKISHEHVIAGNGTTWFIYTIPKAINSKKVLIAGPTYSDYKDACIMHGILFEHCFAKDCDKFELDIDTISQKSQQADTVFICNPNNPTGSLISKEKLEYLIKKHGNTVFIIDESYLPFVESAQDISLATNIEYKNLIVLSSMSKIFKIPGLRTGFLSAPKNLAGKIMGYYQPWSVNAIAQIIITDIFDNPEKIEPFYQKTRSFIKTEKQIFLEHLNNIHGLEIFDSCTYFILASLTNNTKAKDFCQKVGQDKILIRDCSNFQGLCDQYVRFSLKTREDNFKLSQSIKQVLKQ